MKRTISKVLAGLMFLMMLLVFCNMNTTAQSKTCKITGTVWDDFDVLEEHTFTFTANGKVRMDYATAAFEFSKSDGTFSLVPPSSIEMDFPEFSVKGGVYWSKEDDCYMKIQMTSKKNKTSNNIIIYLDEDD